MEDKISVQFPDPEKDYHGHPNYLKVYLALLLFFALSLVVVYILPLHWAVTFIFAVALVKAWLVVANFMHLKYEPGLLILAVFLVVFVLLALFWGVYPDIPHQAPDIAG